MKNSSKHQPTLLSMLVILAFSTFMPALAFAAPTGDNGKDWMNTNGNSWAWNYSPQTQINKNNVQNLEVKWVFPLASKALAPAGIQAAGIGEGTTTPPIVRNGIVYVITSFMKAYAIDAKTGKQIWTNDYSIDIEAAKQRLPLMIAGSVHKHGFQYWESGDAIINHGLACDFYGLDAKTGKEKFHVNDLCKDVPGSLYKYLARRPGAEPSIGIYEKGHQFIYVLAGYMHSTLSAPDARHVTMGIDMDSKQIKWRVFSSPPQDQLSKDWALQECDIGYFRTTSCKDVAAVNQKGLEWDFALPNEKPSMWGGVTANWGQAVIDEDTGIMYTQTGNQGPYSNMTLVPGPRLYGSTIMAIDLNQGKRVWWLQPFPHDPYDYDCNWSGMLINSKALGKVYVKGCKEGIFYVIDAKTGQPKYSVDVIKDQVARGQVSAAAAKSPPDGIRAYMPDPKSYHDMREWNWISYPATKPGEKGEHFTLPASIYPHFQNGIFQTDMSYDPETETMIYYEGALQVDVLSERPYIQGADLFVVKGYPKANTTIVARDITTGKVKWTWFYQLSNQRAAMVVSGGTVFSGFTDGTMKFFNKDTGADLAKINVGAPVLVEPTIGTDSDGNSKIFAVVGSTSISVGPQYGDPGPQIPGTLIALGLRETPVAEVKVTTVTTSTTITTTQAVTTTQSITGTSGLPAEITYAAVAVAIIVSIAAAVLAMQKK
ncbi:MAG: PQQ-binding-like beta-propeller repeat protein [Thaumarchaeota archaeon]|nr:PQQ-binding-like beta-propeller repeat protein [Nitrososphaerota archaeon]MCL5318245.1 PQQ-binding-like beta-propeller repeat protein [Nitrososphaerota archaeon]